MMDSESHYEDFELPRFGDDKDPKDVAEDEENNLVTSTSDQDLNWDCCTNTRNNYNFFISV